MGLNYIRVVHGPWLSVIILAIFMRGLLLRGLLSREFNHGIAIGSYTILWCTYNWLDETGSLDALGQQER